MKNVSQREMKPGTTRPMSARTKPKNVTAGSGHWLALKLRGTKSNRDGIGARIEVTLPSGRKLFNHCTTSVGYASSSEPLVRFGLGKEAIAKLIEIHWPSGVKEEVVPSGVDRIFTVVEGKGIQSTGKP